MGDHGIAILSVREGIEFETVLESDTAPLGRLTEAMLACSPDIRCMRDPTRGGLASALNEFAAASRVGIRLDEAAIPMRCEVHAACEMLGLDPLYVANEGKLVADRSARSRRRRFGGHARASLGTRCSRHRGRGRRAPGHGDSQVDDRRRARGLDVGRRAIAANLLRSLIEMPSW